MRLTLGSTMVGALRTLLTLAWYVVVVGAPLFAGVTVLAVLMPWSMSALSVSGSLPTELRARVRLDGGYPGLAEVTGWVGVESLPTGAALGCVGLWLAGVLVWLPVIGQLRRLTESVLADGPFVPGNIERLSRLGVTVIVVSVVAGLPASGMSWLAAAATDEATREFAGMTLELGWLWLGFVVVALAEVFRTGVELQTDHDLTV
jgi:hypothetical protein